MNRGFFPLLIFLMTLSLIGIILIQRSWINKNESNFERQFVLSVSAAISQVSSQIKERELLDYLSAYQKMIDRGVVKKEFLLKDGLHLNSKGYELLKEILEAAFLKAKI